MAGIRLVTVTAVLVGLGLAMPSPARAQAVERPLPADAPQVVSLPPELDRVLRDYENGWSRRDARALADLFTEDGFVLRPGRPPARGRTAILAAYEGSGGPLTLRPYAYAIADSVGYVIGGFASRADAPDAGKFVLALRKHASGRWLIAADIDNGNS